MADAEVEDVPQYQIEIVLPEEVYGDVNLLGLMNEIQTMATGAVGEPVGVGAYPDSNAEVVTE